MSCCPKTHPVTRRSFLATSLSAALIAAGALTGCGSGQLPQAGSEDPKTSEAPATLTVFAAASLTEAFEAAAAGFEEAHPDLKVVFTFDSSGTLATQIEQGAPADLFIAAGQAPMDKLEAAGALDAVTRTDVFSNVVVLATPSDEKNTVTSFDELVSGLTAGTVTLAMGGADVPVGTYASQILAALGLDEAALAKAGLITYGSNVKEVTTHVKEALVDAGIVYATDAATAGLAVADQADATLSEPALYPAAVLASAAQPELAQEFMSYLTGAGAPYMTNAGFTVLTPEH